MQPATGPYHAPSKRRLILGFVLSVAVPLLVLALWTAHDHGLRFGFGFAAVASFYAVGPVILLGVPALWLLQDHVAPTAWAATLTGAIVASIPWGIAAIVFHSVALVLLMTAPLGAIGGFIFWLVALKGLASASNARWEHL